MADPSSPPPQSWRKTWTNALTNTQAWLRRSERDIRRKVTWGRIYRATSYARSALWIVPFFAIVLVTILTPIIRVLDRVVDGNVFGIGPQGAEALYQTIVTLTLSFLVFTFGSLLVAIQIAGGQLTPRIIATTLLRNNVVRYTVGLFVFSLIFSIMALNRVDASPPGLVVFLDAVLGMACVVAFLFLIDYSARLLRPVSILALVGDEGLDVLKTVYPDPVSDNDDQPNAPALPDSPRRVVVNESRSQIALAVDLDTLMREARRTRGIIEFAPQVGDFVSAGEPLFILYGGATNADDRKLMTSVALGPERTMEQDPLFGFRILVDIALKALSPAINDPTTAVCAIDQVHRLLRLVGRRRLGREVIKDSLGQARVIYRTPNWEDFVHISCNEIRFCGANNTQIARRLRAMLENLMATLPAHRTKALSDERDRLDVALKALYPIPGDLELAMVADSQGLGGSSGLRSRR
jgi:uncharacterized membrane protein